VATSLSAPPSSPLPPTPLFRAAALFVANDPVALDRALAVANRRSKITPRPQCRRRSLRVQDTVMDMQIGLEDGFERVLRTRGRPGVLLCDRGLMDGSAYMSGSRD
jgi:hypothetical protein